jgi:hypothetical protein
VRSDHRVSKRTQFSTPSPSTVAATKDNAENAVIAGNANANRHEKREAKLEIEILNAANGERTYALKA